MLSFLIVSHRAEQSAAAPGLSWPTPYCWASLALAYGLGANLDATLQVLLGLGAGFVFMIAFTQLAHQRTTGP